LVRGDPVLGAGALWGEYGSEEIMRGFIGFIMRNRLVGRVGLIRVTDFLEVARTELYGLRACKVCFFLVDWKATSRS